MADPLTAALMPEFYYDEEGRPNITIRPIGRMQPADETGVTAGQYGLPPFDAGGPEVRALEPNATDLIARALLGPGRASPEHQRSVEILTGSTGLGPSSRAPISIMDALGVNPALDLESKLHEGDVAGAGKVAAPYALPGVGGVVGKGISELSRAIMRNPAKAIGAVGGATLFAGASEAGSKEDPVKALQRELQRDGYYTGAIDGVGGKGTETQKALERRDADRQRKRRDELEVQKIEAEKGKAEAEKSAAAARLEETKRLTVAATKAAEDKIAGEKRLKDAEQSVGVLDSLLRSYGPLVGTVAGIGTGMGGKLFVNGSYRGTTQKAATRANELIENKGRTMQSKAAALNQFWGEGQGRPLFGQTKVPYKSTNADPGFSRNPKAPGGAELYQPNKTANAFLDMGVASGFGAEWQAVEQMLQPGAQKEVKEAREAVQKDPSEVNVNRLQAALNRAALTDALSNWGRSAGLGYLATATKARREHVRPDIAKAEKERFILDTALNQYRVKKGEDGAGQFAGKAKPKP